LQSNIFFGLKKLLRRSSLKATPTTTSNRANL